MTAFIYYLGLRKHLRSLKKIFETKSLNQNVNTKRKSKKDEINFKGAKCQKR